MTTDRAQARREEIVTAAIEQLAERGIASTRVTDVAKALGISSGLIFYHFETKEQLFAEAFSFAAGRVLAEVATVASSNVDVRERLQQAFTLYQHVEGSLGWRVWIDGWSEALRNEPLRIVTEKLNRSWVTVIETLIVEGIESGEFEIADATAAAVTVLALLDGQSLRTVLWPDLAVQTAVRAAVSSAIDAILDGTARPETQLPESRESVESS